MTSAIVSGGDIARSY